MSSRQILTEGLTKGSQRILNDKKLVPDLADAIRDDVQMNPGPFTNIGPVKAFQKLQDPQLATWFLENLDAIERAGYEGTIYSRDGANSEWIVRRYIAGSHNWEDLTGVMNMNLRNWYELKKEGILDAEHRDIPKFKGVRDIGRYITMHYAAKLKEIQDKAALAFQAKLEKYIKLVDNDDYRIYTTLNWAANCRLGLGTQWCTANSQSDGNYRNYSSSAMLFQLFPYEKAEKTKGKKTLIGKEFNINGKSVQSNEKYQFDAGGSSHFMDNLDTPVKPALISERFPFLYDDLVTALKDNKEKLEAIFVELSQDSSLQEPKGKVIPYDIDKEISKLAVFETNKFFTKKKRPATKPVEEPADPTAAQIAQAPQLPQEPVAEHTINKGNIMENVDKDVAAMLGSLKKYDKLVESCAPVLMARPKVVNEEDSGKPWEKDKEEVEDVEEEVQADEEQIEESSDWQEERRKDHRTPDSDGGEAPWRKEERFKAEREDAERKKYGNNAQVEENVSEGVDPDIIKWMARFAKLGDMKGYGR